jgi:hypothetical protein
MTLLDAKLSHQQKADLFYELLDFHYENVSDSDEKPVYILYNENYEEYEGNFKFNTLRDFFNAVTLLAKEEGKEELKRHLKELLGLK